MTNQKPADSENQPSLLWPSHPQTKSALLKLPEDIRFLVYDQLTTSSFLIDVSLDITTTLSPIIPLLRSHSFLNDELTRYLSAKPVTLYCSRGHRPTVLHRIPKPILQRAEVIVIEDSPIAAIELSLLPNLRCICFCEVLQSTITLPDHMPVPARETLLALPANDALLKLAHAFWKDLRIECPWIRMLWKDRTDIRVVLRRVLELEVMGRDVVVSWHGVVDVDTIRVIAKGFLPTRKRDEEVVYDYGNARWWRRPGKEVEAKLSGK